VKPDRYGAGMEHRDRLVRLVRRADADLAEAALLCCLEVEPELDVDVMLLRIDALADQLRTGGFVPGDPDTDARAIAHYLAVELGFTGDRDTYYHPDNALLSRVLDRKRGLPITLAVLYVSIARRLSVQAYPVGLPGHVVAAVAGPERPVVVDVFHDGEVLDDDALAERLAEVSDGRVPFHRAMLRPSPSVEVVRRLLNNLTRDLLAVGDPASALRTVELKLELPNRTALDHRAHGQLLEQLGRFRAAATAYERYLELAGEDVPDADEVRRAAIGAKARLN
jgi:regulator of sirC expression with transglutaminase-like and TPR domain